MSRPSAFEDDVRLRDDGSLDTLVEVYCVKCDEWIEERFSTEYAIDFRHKDGSMGYLGLKALGEQALDSHYDGMH